MAILVSMLDVRLLARRYITGPIEELSNISHRIMEGTFEGDLEVVEDSDYVDMQRLLQSGKVLMDKMMEHQGETQLDMHRVGAARPRPFYYVLSGMLYTADTDGLGDRSMAMLDRLADGLYRVRGPFGSNVYIVSDGGLTMVDGGFPMDLPAVLLGLKSLGAGPRDVDMAIATHYHGDHTGTMARMQAAGAEVAMHPEDAPYASGERPQETCDVALHKLLFYTALWPLFRYRHFRPDRQLREGDRLDLLGGMVVLHTPGHSPGSLCLYAERRGILFSGDLIRNEKGVLEGPPPHFTPDQDSARVSLSRVRELDFEMLLPGHGEVIARGAGERYRSLAREGRIWPL